MIKKNTIYSGGVELEKIEKLCREGLLAIKDNEGIYTLDRLKEALEHIITPKMNDKQLMECIIQVSLELTTEMEPKWQYVSARLYTLKLYDEVKKIRGINSESGLYSGLYKFIEELTEEGLYGKYILENYTEEEVKELENVIKPERDFLFTYSGISLLSKRYLVHNYDREVVELPQQMFMGIAMHLAIPEEKENRVNWAIRFYDVLSSLKATMATPTMSNARKPFYQLSSCFIDTVDDSLKGIYKSLDNFAEVSKFGGGMGIYIGKVRALGSAIRGFKGMDVILIDTTGRSSKNTMQISELRAFTEKAKPDSVSMVISATTKNRDVETILQGYKYLNYDNIIITKLDETTTYGAIYNISKRSQKPIRYIATGQNVPDDIKNPSKDDLMKFIFGEESLC